MNNLEVKKANLDIAKEMLNKGMETLWAKKAGQVIAVKANEGDKITTYTENGNIEVDEEIAHADQYLLTRAGEDGKPILDEFGHMNQRFMDRDKFKKKYNEPDENNIATPAGVPQHFVKIDRDIELMIPWGEDGTLVVQSIRAGGYINITNENDVYGIAEEEFKQTYKIQG